ncbi:phosphoribosyltransferase, partial [Escherichia coli]|uniref:phosphoribosyltransferase n=1 Tax=Escherichia coli TaxID=562 RepID=UPI00201AD1DC
RIDSSKPIYRQNRCCKNGSDHRFRFISKHGEEVAFQIKSIRRVKLRKHISPLIWGHAPATPPPRGILLIDDMVTSGTSLVNAEAILKHRYPLARIEALTLFGSSK